MCALWACGSSYGSRSRRFSYPDSDVTSRASTRTTPGRMLCGLNGRLSIYVSALFRSARFASASRLDISKGPTSTRMLSLITLFPLLFNARYAGEESGQRHADSSTYIYTSQIRFYRESRVALYVYVPPLLSTSTRNQPSGISSVPSAPSLYRDHSFEPSYQPSSLRVV